MELYVHIPFCRKKCRYCSFASFPGREDEYEEYVDLLLEEARLRLSEAAEPIDTVYIGGGTPSLLPPVLMRRLLSGLKSIYGITQVPEWTSEANPGTVTTEWLEAALSEGVNRLSLGMQAAQNSLLEFLGRIHTFREVQDSVSLARSAGFGNISLDLIFGIPGQSRGDWMETLQAALSLQPEHLSVYGLIPEEGTPLFTDLREEKIRLPEPEEERTMYDDAIRLLARSGYSQYEISNFAEPGYECRHNIGYWTQIPYIGLGVSAASMTGVQRGSRGMVYRRSVNPESPEDYRDMIRLKCGPSSETVREADSRFETMMLGLRMNRGVDENDFQRKHSVSVEQCYGDKLRLFEREGLMIHQNHAWRMTRRGFDIQNSVLVELMPDSSV